MSEMGTDHRRMGLLASGAVLGLVLTGCGAGGSSGSPSSTAPDTAPSHASSSESSGGSSGASVSRQEAGQTVTDKYGGKVTSVESDHEKGQATWEVEVRDSRKGRIEVDVSKDSGKIVAFEKED